MLKHARRGKSFFFTLMPGKAHGKWALGQALPPGKRRAPGGEGGSVS